MRGVLVAQVWGVLEGQRIAEVKLGIFQIVKRCGVSGFTCPLEATACSDSGCSGLVSSSPTFLCFPTYPNGVSILVTETCSKSEAKLFPGSLLV